ncbi:MAG: CDGSH iron-sulfur domain-containing protein [Alphaproteobacteria bacterium]|nr:CDGSH iron-sulfur domain-containing protein [Alphaproteobacteria bacterium]MBN9576789.1 CDGSH iron-sulfur domain-containing protein [Alphaproteobacteria bacterium]
MAEVEEYPGTRLTVRNDGRRCIHSRYCVLGLPDVFVPNVDGPWIRPDAEACETVIAAISQCPSGALSYRAADPAANEKPPGVNTIRVWQDGPLAVHAELNIGGDTMSYRATLCRCGKSFHKPYCDGMHRKARFTATGEPTPQKSEPLAVRNGPLNVTPTLNGPLHVEGALEICSASGQTITRTTETWLCRCGHSKDKPFCDGSHEAAGFTADGEA